MSCATSVRWMTNFDDLCRGKQGYSTNLAKLYNEWQTDKCRHTINFKEALRRLINKIEETFKDLKLQSDREIKEFTIGKTFAKTRKNATFNSMSPATWSLGGGITGRWQFYKRQNYDGLIVIGCIERNTIPENVTDASPVMNQQTYALGLELGLIQHFILHEPDKRIQNKSFDPGNLSTTPYKAGIVYVAYKLEPEHNSDGKDGTGTENVDGVLQERQSAMARLEIHLKKRKGLSFQNEIPLEGASFFEACSRQMESVGIPVMDPSELRLTTVQVLKLLPRDVSSAAVTKERWDQYLQDLGSGSDIVEDIVLDRIAKLLDRQIIIYFIESIESIDRLKSKSINDQASRNGTPLLLGRHEHHFHGLCRFKKREDISTPEVRHMKRSSNNNCDSFAKKIKLSSDQRINANPVKGVSFTEYSEIDVAKRREIPQSSIIPKKQTRLNNGGKTVSDLHSISQSSTTRQPGLQQQSSLPNSTPGQKLQHVAPTLNQSLVDYVISEVMFNLRDEGVDDEVLKEMKQLWQSKLHRLEVFEADNEVQVAKICDTTTTDLNESFLQKPSHDSLLIAGRVRDIIKCNKCRRPRCLYSAKQLNENQTEAIDSAKHKRKYICGKSLFDEDHQLYSTIVTRPSIDCKSPMETTYYGATTIKFDECCFYCGQTDNLLNNADINDLKNKFNVVRPLCMKCKSSGKEAKTWGSKNRNPQNVL